MIFNCFLNNQGARGIKDIGMVARETDKVCISTHSITYLLSVAFSALLCPHNLSVDEAGIGCK